MALDADDKELVKLALVFADRDPENLNYGIREAMRRRPRSDTRHYSFVFHLLEAAAKKELKIEKARRKSSKRPMLVLTG